MKKGLLLLLVCMVLSSCQNVNDPSINTNNPSTPETIQGEGKIEFTTYEILKRSYNDIGDFFELELQLPKLTGDYKGIADINRAFAELETYYEEIMPSEIHRASIYRAEGKRDGYNISAFYQFEAAVNDLISVSAYVEYNMAGGSGGASFEGRTFNLNTGERLDLSDLFKVEENEYMDRIYDLASEIILDDIEKNEGISPYLFDNPYSEEGKELIRSFNQDDYYLTENALVICYEKYVLAAGASGPQKIEIPFTSLADIFDIDMNSKQQIEVNVDQEVKKAPVETFEPEDFAGIYSRTNIQKENQGTLRIENQTEYSFDFFMDGDIPDNMHPGSGSAVIVSPNMAIWKTENNHEVLFWLNEGVITLGYQDISGDKAREETLVSGVSFEDEYTKNRPKILHVTNYNEGNLTVLADDDGNVIFTVNGTL